MAVKQADGEVDADDVDNVVELSTIARSTFETSPRRSFQQVAADKQEATATYDPDRIFIGWSLGGKELYQKLVDHYKTELKRQGITDFRTLRNDAIQYALEEFPNQLGRDKWREPVFMDRPEPDIALIGGQRGSGKSFNIRAMSNRGAKAGVTSILVDIEHEYYSNNQYHGIQSPLENLRSNESPQKVDTVVLMPYFIYKARKDKQLKERGYQHVHVFKFSFADLTADEIHFVLTNLDDHRDYQLLASEITARVNDSNYDISGWEDVFRVAEEMDADDMFNWKGGGRVRQLKNTIKTTYKNYEFLGDDRPIRWQKRDEDGNKVSDENGDPVWECRNLAEILRTYNTVALSLHDGDALPSNLKMKELYLAIMIKKVRNLSERQLIPRPIEWWIDEAHEAVPKGVDGPDYPSKKQVKQAIKEDRKRGFRVNLATQTPKDLDMENILDQLTHVFIPQNISDTAPKKGEKSARRIMLSLGGVHEDQDSQRGKWDAIFGAMDKYQWLYIDKDQEYWTVLEPASPLANHRESDESS